MIEVAVGVLVLVLVFAACWVTQRRGKDKEVEEAVEVRQAKKKIIVPKKQKFRASKVVPDHSRYVNAFKGFEAPVVDFDVKPGLCAVACQDGTLKIFEFKNITEDFRFAKTKLEADVPSAIAVSQRGLVAVALDFNRSISLYSSEQKNLVIRKAFPRVHTDRIIRLEITGELVVSCAEEGDTEIRVWNMDGSLLHSYNTSMVKNYDMTLSPDGRLLGIIAWISDIRLLEIEVDKRTKDFRTVSLAMDLRGHSKGSVAVVFNPSGTQVVTLAKDCKLRHWNVAVQYELREDAKLLRTIDLPPDFLGAEKVAWTDSVICLSAGNVLRFYEFPSFKLLDEVTQAHATSVKKLRTFSHEGKLYFCSVAQDGRVNIWKS